MLRRAAFALACLAGPLAGRLPLHAAVYQFSGAETADSKIFEIKAATAPPSQGPQVAGEQPLGDSDYSKVQSLDGSLAEVRVRADDPEQAAVHKFQFRISEPSSTVDSLEIFWHGFGRQETDTRTYEARLYLWNGSPSQWVFLSSHTASSVSALAPKITQPAENIDSSGWIYYLALARKTTADVRLETDYTQLVVVQADPPSPVGDLAAAGPGPGRLRLDWSAPGEDGALGPLTAGSRYRIQYSTYSTPAWSTAAAQVSFSTTTSAPGQAQSHVLIGLADNATYFVRLWTADALGNWSPISNAASVALPAAAPTGVGLASPGTSGLDAAWSTTNEASTRYRIELATTADFNSIVVATQTAPGATGVSFSGLSPNTTFFARATALAGIGNDQTSAGSSGRATLAAPPGSAGPSTVSAGSIAWSWSLNGNPPGTQLLAQDGTGSSGWIADLSSWTSSGKTPNTPYTLTVRARNHAGIETAAVSAGAYTSIETPGSLSFPVVGHSSVTVQSDAGLSNLSAGQSGLLLTNQTAPAASGWIQDLVWTSSDLSQNTLYAFKAQARNANGELTPETLLFSTYTRLAAPAGAQLALTADGTAQITVTVADPPNPALAQTGCEFLSLTGSAQGGSGSGRLSGLYGYVDDGLTPNTLYGYQVRYFNAAGVATDYGPEARRYTRAAVPAALSVSAPAEDELEISWSANNNPDGTRFIAELSRDGSSGVLATIQTTDTSADFDYLSPNTTYQVRLKARNQENLDTPYGAPASAVTLASPPSAADFAEVTGSALTSRWFANGNPSQTLYEVELATVSDFGSLLASSATLNLWSRFTGLAPGMAYFARVRSRNAAGLPSAYTALGSTRTLEGVPPAAIQDLTATTPAQSNTVLLRWTATGDDGYQGQAAGCQIKYATHPIDLFNFDAPSTLLYSTPTPSDPAGTPQSETIAGLADDTAYYFAVKCYDEASNASGISNSPRGFSAAAPKIVSARTVDSDSNGRLDAYRLVFSTAIQDSGLDPSAFAVLGRSGLAVVSTGTAAHPDVPDDAVIYLRFDEAAAADTAAVPDLLYSSALGGVRSLAYGIPLAAVAGADLVEADGAAPAILAATASDDSGLGPGIQSGDRIEIVFSEETNTPALGPADIDAVLRFAGRSWLSGNGSLLSATWRNSTILSVALSSGGGLPTLAVGELLTPDGAAIQDRSGNAAASPVRLGGSFGLDTAPPAILSRRSADLNGDGFLDAMQIEFSEPVRDSSLRPADFQLAGVGALALVRPAGDAVDDAVLYVAFPDGLLATDQTPAVSYSQGTLADLSGNLLASVPATPCSDGAGPVLLAAVADDGGALVRGVDADDSVRLRFSEPTLKPSLSASNLDALLALSGGHSWGPLESATWDSSGRELTVRFGAGAAGATLAEGDRITPDPSLFRDPLGNAARGSAVLSGCFTGIDQVAPWVVSAAPGDGATGVASDTAVRILFSESMDAQRLKQAFRAAAVEDAQGNPTTLALAFSLAFDAPTRTLTAVPEQALPKNHRIEVVLSTQAADTIGNPLPRPLALKFRTALDPALANLVKADSGKSALLIPPRVFDREAKVSIQEDALRQPLQARLPVITEANRKWERDRESAHARILADSSVEISVRDLAGGPMDGALRAPVSLSLGYADSDSDGWVDGTSPPIPAASLEVYLLDEEHALWTRLPGSQVDPVNHAVRVTVPHLSLFTLVGSAATDLSAAFAFPVPFRPDRGDTRIRFTNLSAAATVDVFTLEGVRVRRIEHNSGLNFLDWDVKNDRGSPVASGVYLYRIKNASSVKKGKLMVIR